MASFSIDENLKAQENMSLLWGCDWSECLPSFQGQAEILRMEPDPCARCLQNTSIRLLNHILPQANRSAGRGAEMNAFCVVLRKIWKSDTRVRVMAIKSWFQHGAASSFNGRDCCAAGRVDHLSGRTCVSHSPSRGFTLALSPTSSSPLQG